MTSEDVQALLDAQITFPDSPIRLHRHGGYVQAMSAYEVALADALEASAVSSPSGDIEGLIEYVRSVLRDSKYSGDIEWVRGNLDPDHLRRTFGAVSSPPTITAEMRERVAKAIFHADLGDDWSWDQVADPADYFEMADAALAAALHPGGETNG